ncbi:MAG: DUF983 domain-containing protein [Hyphomicrobiaceae bacterium]
MTDTGKSVAGGRAERDAWQSIWRGFFGKCPACGVGKLFSAYLKIQNHCPNCNETLHHHRADDAPAYFTILVVGHIIVGLVLSVEVAFSPPYWVHMLLWAPMTIVLSLLLLSRIKGALVGLQWAFYMHGFDPDAPDEDEAAKETPLA